MSYADNLANEGKRRLLCLKTLFIYGRDTETDECFTEDAGKIDDILTELAQIAHDYDVKLHDVEDELRAEQELRLERSLR